ncbi:retrovirus-related pol polyprotein from transposon TNT 1-94 [Tanacetum coccineum]
MKEIFKSMEAEVDQNAIDLRSVELEAENLNLHKKIQNDDHDNMVKHLLRLEVDNFNLQLKYQHLKDRTGTSKSRTSKDAPEFDAFFELNEKDAQLQTHKNTISKLKAQISQLKANKSDVTGTLFPLPLESQNFQLQDTINKLQKENDCFHAENSKIKQHYKELYDSIKITRATHIEKITSLLNEIETLKTQVKGKMPVITNENVIPKVSVCNNVRIPDRKIVEELRFKRPLDRSLASDCLYTKHSQELLEYAIGTCPKDFNQRDKKHVATPLNIRKQSLLRTNVKLKYTAHNMPRSKTKKNRILPAKSVNTKNVEEHPRTNKSSRQPKNRVDSSISSKRTVVQIVLWYLDLGCSKHMTRDPHMWKEAQEFREKCDLQDTFRTDNGTEFVNHVLTQYYESVGIFHQTSVLRTPQQNGVVKRRNRTLVEAARTMLIFSKAPVFLWVEAIATACYSQN